MKIRINGQITELEVPVTVFRLLEAKGIRPGQVVVQYNGDIIDTDAWDRTPLKENDELELLRFVGGG